MIALWEILDTWCVRPLVALVEGLFVTEDIFTIDLVPFIKALVV